MRSLQRSFQISDCCCTTSRPSTRLQPCVTSIGKGELLRTCIAAHRAWLQVLTPRSQRRKSVLIRAGLRIVETYDASFDLAKESHETLESLLSSPTFCKQVIKETGQPEGTEVEYTRMIFQPVPWSPTTKKGMPAEFEKYNEDPDYVFINIPPNFMFKAKIFKPSRLCAIYKRV